ncbi:MAG: DUF1080 domain-containing protein [Siphonobacter aquaeclarae]|nr:DUF1080 domain-containing protein [Siphonobacter aquaeclarae]
MKKVVYSILLAALLAQAGWAQDNRTQQTRIADLLMKAPASNSVQLTSLMAEVATLGEAGLTELASMMTPQGKGDNTQIQYALSGFSYYAAQGNRESDRLLASKAYQKALTKISDPDAKAFLIAQLQMVGKNEAVATLAKFLTDDRLADPAARALVKINTPAAQQALLSALKGATGNRQLSLIEALGDTRAASAVAAVTPFASSNDVKVRKVALYALAHIGNAASGPVIQAQASKAGYTFDEANASSSYLYWIKRAAENGQAAVASKAAKALLAAATKPTQLHTRSGALSLIASIEGDKSLPLLVAAAGDANGQYRGAALKNAQSFKGKGATWVAALKTAAPAAQADIIRMLGNQQDASVLSALTSEVKNSNAGVRLAAIEALGKIGQGSSLTPLLSSLTSGDAETIAAAKTALLSLKGTDVSAPVASALSGASSGAQVALLDILGARKASAHATNVLALTGSSDAAVKSAAIRNLSGVATAAQLPALFSLLKSVSGQEDIKAVQSAIVQASAENPSQRISLILGQLSSAPAEKKPLFYGILAQIGGKEALKTVVGEFQNNKAAVIEALSQWSDASAAPELFRIGQSVAGTELLDPALKGFVRLVAKSNYPDAQKLVLLKNGMELAATTEQKRLILNEVSRTRTLPSLMFAGKFLDDAAVAPYAANAVTSIAMSNKEWNGEEVKALLTKSLGSISGTDSEYLKTAVRKHIAELPQGAGYVSLFNGKDLTGWKGLVANPIKRAQMDATTLAAEQKKADDIMRTGWKVENGVLLFTAHGDNICTEKKYGDFEMYVDWKIFNDGKKNGDAGIYLRGTPQVQMWDTSRRDVGAQVGSGGLYNNQKNESKPSKVADNPLGEWNNFRIVMRGDRVTVYLNGELVVNNVPLENYWDRKLPLFTEEQIELQAHGSPVAYRDIFIKELPKPKAFELSADEKKEGFEVLFDGTNLDKWTGNLKDYVVEDGNLVIYPTDHGHGNLYTKEEFPDFHYRFEFQLTPGANNGLGIRTPLEGDAAYVGMELQILDNDAEIYKNLQPYQYHGSVYGIIPAKRGYLKPLGEWNYEEVIVKGSKVKVILNGTTIVDGDLEEATKNGPADHKSHPGVKNKTGHLAFLGHGSVVKFRNIRVKRL